MADPKSIKAIVFDYGGVIELYADGNTIEIIANLLRVPQEEFKSAYFQHNHLANVHELKWEDVIIKVVSLFDKRKEMERQVRSLLEIRESKKRINVELLTLFSLLRQKGFKIAIFSNYGRTLREKLKEEGILELVDELVISGEIGFQKPHQEAFKILFEKLGVEPGEVIFIDDTAKSLENAEEIGYIPIHFTNNEQLKDELGKLGVV